MPLANAVLAVAGVTIIAIWGVLKLVKWSLNAETPEIRRSFTDENGVYHKSFVEQIAGLLRLAILVVLLLAFGPGLADWLIGIWHVLMGLI